MNVEFHYYSTALLAVKAGFSPPDAATLAYASQYVDHHNRALEIAAGTGTVFSRPTQNYSFWDEVTVGDVLMPFHFLPAGEGYPTVRRDGASSPFDVRPNSEPAKRLLVEALKTRDLYRVGLALHTFSDTWAHQNFTARDEAWNRLDANNPLPSPGHLQAGTAPDLWLAEWDDPRLTERRVVNFTRFADCARKMYRYLCVFQGKDFKTDEDRVADTLALLIEKGRGRDSVEDRMLEFVLALDLEPYDKTTWLRAALEPSEAAAPLERWKTRGEELLGRAGLAPTRRMKAKPGFPSSHLAKWMAAAEEHRTLAKGLIASAT